ncbi:hypothetical protein BD769DRAFT_1678073 [Suillus cothurnatus]|nr:hypothetical protein BD769DRAFT_1678073 [Suillus cothurnatus]
MAAEAPLVPYGLLKHEHMTFLYFPVRQNKECGGSIGSCVSSQHARRGGKGENNTHNFRRLRKASQTSLTVPICVFFILILVLALRERA